MYCPSCGTEVPENAVFCHKCGERATDQVNPVESSAEPLPKNAHFSSQITSSPQNSNVQLQSDPLHETEKELWTGGYSARAMIPTAMSIGTASIAAFIAAFFVDFLADRDHRDHALVDTGSCAFVPSAECPLSADKSTLDPRGGNPPKGNRPHRSH